MRKPKTPKKVQSKNKVKIAMYDSSKNDNLEEMEEILSKITFDDEKYELVSMDKGITPVGNFVMVIIYKESNIPDLTEDDLEVVENLER